MTQEELELYNKLEKEVRAANIRLLKLEKLTGKPYSWAGRKLYDELSVEKLNAWTKRNRIRISKDMTKQQLLRIGYSVNKFLHKEPTSTIRGVKKRAKEIQTSFQTGIGVTMERAERIYQAFEEDIIKWALRYFDASELWALIEEARESKMSYTRFEEEFLKRAKNVGNIDADFKDLINELYNQEVM